MRIVAVAIVLISLVAIHPQAVAADDCANPGMLSFCIPIDANRPNSPPGVPSAPPSPYWDNYYVWLGAGHCTSLGNLNDCRGSPPSSSGIPHPTGGTIQTPAVFGVLYQETNGMNGLQRFFTSRAGDTMVLI